MRCYALFKSLNRSSTYLGFGSIPILINKPFTLFGSPRSQSSSKVRPRFLWNYVSPRIEFTFPHTHFLCYFLYFQILLPARRNKQ